MSWLPASLILLVLFFAQAVWAPNLPWAPEFLLAWTIILALQGREKRIFWLILPAALLRAFFSADPPFLVLGFFCLAAFLILVGRKAVFSENRNFFFTLAFLTTFAFFVMSHWATGGVPFLWQAALGSSLLTGLMTPILASVFRGLPGLRQRML